MDIASLRGEFPVLARFAYLNAGTDGPLAAKAVAAGARELEREAEQGRARAHFERRRELSEELRSAYAKALACEPANVAITTSTSEGIAQTISGLELGRGDEIVTSDEEHPGLLGALAAARELRGVRIREVPLERLADAVGRRTRVVACSHVGWMSGSLAPAELADVDVPVLLDGAQGLGAIGVDVGALGCDAYAGAGQKWLCGPDGTGMLYVSPDLRARLAIARRGFSNLADPDAGLRASLHPDARCLDSFALSAETLACALVAIRLLESTGWGAVHARGSTLAARLALLLAERGREPAPRGETTLVSFPSTDPPAEQAHLGERGIIVRYIPQTGLLRASVGAWNNEDDLERLLEGLGL